VVSGLARGIDQAAHEGALAAGGHTVAVLGTGVFEVYPPSGMALAERIVAEGGALVSEVEPDATPRRYSFPQRNRIIAGLVRGVVVVEAGPRSGSLITADLAQGVGRDLFAVPGSILEPLSRGPNRLLRDGAILVECASDILDHVLGIASRDRPRDDEEVAGERTEDERPPDRPPLARSPEGAERGAPRGGPIDSDAKRVLDALDREEPRELGRIAAETGLSFDVIMRALGRLELARRVRAAPAGHLRRA
jgi:DNA processing protein